MGSSSTSQYRPSARQRGYTHRWDKARATYLNRHPLCVMCQREGRITAAGVVDHVVPHKGDQALFWDRSNWQPLCKPHHDRDKQREERGSVKVVIGDDGWPVEA
jgi:5-methylcytosine-specific restriction protein A